MRAPFVQFYFEGLPVFAPLFVQSLRELPIVKAGKTPMLDLRSGKYNVDCAIVVNPTTQKAIVYTITVTDNVIAFEEI